MCSFMITSIILFLLGVAIVRYASYKVNTPRFDYSCLIVFGSFWIFLTILLFFGLVGTSSNCESGKFQDLEVERVNGDKDTAILFFKEDDEHYIITFKDAASVNKISSGNYTLTCQYNLNHYGCKIDKQFYIFSKDAENGSK